MKICLVTTLYPRFEDDPSGQFVFEHAKNLANKHFVTVVLPNKKHMESNAFEIEKYGFSKLSFLMLISSIMKTARIAANHDVIHAYGLLSGIVGMFLKKIYGKPFVLTIYEPIRYNFFTKNFKKKILESADFVCFTSSYLRDDTLKIVHLENYDIIPIGIDEQKFNPYIVGSLKRSLNIKGRLVLGLGDLEEENGFSYLIKAMSDVNASCVLIGSGSEDEKLESLVDKLELEKKVSFMTTISMRKLPGYLKDADVFVIPVISSNKRNTRLFGLVEAMSCGIPVIGAKTNGMQDFIDDGKNGFLVEQKNIKDLSQKINNILKNRKMREEMEKNARKKVLNIFSWTVVIGKLEKIYQLVL